MHSHIATGVDDPRLLRVNSPGMEEYVDFNTYNIWIPAQAFTALLGSYVITNISRYPVIELPDAATTRLAFGFRKPRQWKKGVVSARIWYTGTEVAGTNAICTLEIPTPTIGDVLAGTTASANTAIPSPGTTNELCKFDDFSFVNDGGNATISFSDHFISIVFTRLGTNGSDNYTSTLYVLGIEVVYRETNHQSPSIKPDPWNRNYSTDRS